MPTLKENLARRVSKLMKPSNAQQALQPLLEAVSNSVMAIDEKFANVNDGRVKVQISELGESFVEISVRDNGIGLDDDHFDAFLVVDTPFKELKGGKGVGRLYWLDAFGSIEVESQYLDANGIAVIRAFKFVVSDAEQIQFINPIESWSAGQTGTVVRFRGLKTNSYIANFPKKPSMVINHTASEFIAAFLSAKSPKLEIDITTHSGVQTSAVFPNDLANLVLETRLGLDPIIIGEFGSFDLQAFLCDKRTSRGMGTKHALHLLGNGRTVETRKIDDLVGGGNFQTSEGSDLRMHLILSSTYLDERTAESRTAFTIPENDLAEISRTVVDFVRAEVFADQFESWEADRRQAFNSFLADQPIFAFQDPDELFEKSIPHNASSPEAFVRSLSVLRMRRENEREKQLSELVGTVVTGDRLPENFSELVATAARGIQANELTSLAHHAARRKVVLELLDRMIRRVRDTEEGTPASNHLENTLHTLLAPMRTMGTDPADIVRSSHDLWILDERLTYTAGFSSDQQLRKTVSNSPSSDRPDILLWNTGFGLAPIEEPYGNGDVDDIEPLSRVFIVELKRPGRTKYGSADLIESQIMKYVAQIRGGRIEGFGRRSIRISNDCQFYGLAIADFTPQLLENELDRWEPIDNGTGRRRSFATQNIVIDVIEWSSALKSARERNRALLSMAGLKLRANAAFDKPTPSLSDG